MRKIREDLYQIGDLVKFKPDYGAEYIAQHGPGPFPVLRIVQHKNELEEDQYGEIVWSCAGIGHTQWVEIELDGIRHQFSGAYFIPIARE